MDILNLYLIHFSNISIYIYIFIYLYIYIYILLSYILYITPSELFMKDLAPFELRWAPFELHLSSTRGRRATEHCGVKGGCDLRVVLDVSEGGLHILVRR